MKLILILVVLAAAALAAAIRLAPYETADWHVDPAEAADPGGKGVRIAPPQTQGYAVDPEALAGALDRAVLALPRSRRVAGSPEEGRMTYLVRTALWGFPDFVTVAVYPEAEGATFAILSRSRFGDYDWGVNAARVETILGNLKSELGAG